MDHVQRIKRHEHKKRQIDMLHGPLWNKLIIFALPLALTGVLQQLFNAADVAVLGQFVGTHAMAAVGNNTPVISLFVTLFLGLSLGANVVIARYLGARCPEQASEAVHTTFMLALLVGILLMILGEATAGIILSHLGVPDVVMPAAELYLRIYMLGLPFISFYNFQSAIFRSRGDTRTPLVALAVASGLNIVLNLLFTGLFSGGVAGVAIATVLSYGVGAAILFVALLHSGDVLELHLHDLCLKRVYLAPVLRIGLPAGLQGMVFCISNIIIQSAINSLGADAMAASAAAFTIEINVYCIINSFGQAATTFVSQNYGARNIRRCRNVMWWCLGLNAFFMGLMALFIYWKAIPMLGFFSSDPLVIGLGNTRIIYVVYTQFINILIEILSGAMRGYGFSLPPAVLTLIGICGVRIAWVYAVFPSSHTFATLMASYPISWIVTAVLLGLLYYRYVHRLPHTS